MCDKYKKKLYQLQFESNNLFLEQEDVSLDETDSGNEINTYSREITVQMALTLTLTFISLLFRFYMLDSVQWNKHI
jgi:hypothetical protein